MGTNSFSFVYFKKLCNERNIDLTELREDVLQILCEHKLPISAYELLRKLRTKRSNAEPPTVYRVLDFFLQNHLIHKIESTNSYLLCKHEKQHNPLLVCKSCHTTSELDDNNIVDKINLAAKKYGFTLESDMAEIRGLCTKCS